MTASTPLSASVAQESLHESLIDSLTLFHNTLVAICYIDPTDHILPPPDGHEDINIDATREAGLSDSVVALLQHLPYLSEDLWGLSILPNGTQPATYLFEDNFDWARTPTFQDQPETKSTQFVLTRTGGTGTAVIYDTETCNVIPWNPSDGHLQPEGPSNVPLGSAYAHVKAYTPEELIVDDWVRSLLSLAWLPYYFGSGFNDEGEDVRELVTDPSVDELRRAVGDVHRTPELQRQLIQRTLKDVYIVAGWNMEAEDCESASISFDRGCFVTKKAQWLQHTQAVLDRAYRETWPWRTVREKLGGSLASSEKAGILDNAMPPGWQPRHIQL